MTHRRAYRRSAVVVGAALTACQFTAGQLPNDSGVVIDADAVVDGSLCPTTFTACTDELTLESCTQGSAPMSMTCPWGCIGPSPATCGEISPTGGAATGSDFVVNASDMTLTGISTIDTDTGAITTGPTGGGSLTWTTMRTVSVGNGVRIFQVGSLMISGTLTFTGSAAAAFVAVGAIDIEGDVDVRGSNCITNGANDGAGPGGWNGAQANSNGSGSGSGGQAKTNSDGGGGGGYGSSGGSGGYGTTAGNAGAAGPMWGSASVPILIGGGGGGAENGGSVGSGGGGGGAIQLVSNVSILIGSGSINAGGCGGGGGDNSHAGGGGGAGGAIVLEAPMVTVNGQLAVNGGGGGGGDNGSMPGSAGALGSNAALGGTGQNANEHGASGAAGTTYAGGSGGSNATHAGGGGGGVGWILLDSRLGSATTTISGTAVVSPPAGATGSTTTIATAKIE